MKKVITFLLFILSLSIVYSKPNTDTIKKYLVTGTYVFMPGASVKNKIWKSNEAFTISIFRVSHTLIIDKTTEKDIKDFLLKLGIKDSDILHISVYTSSANNAVELFFSAMMAWPAGLKQHQEITINNNYIPGGTISKEYIKLNRSNYINTDSLRNHLDYLTLTQTFTGYNVWPIYSEKAILNIIARGIRDGAYLAMHFNGSYKYVDAFKALKWARIEYYDENGTKKIIDGRK